MHIIHLNDITINHAGRIIFRDLGWVIGDRDRIGLVGPNGAGKSSLLKLIVGDLAPAAGRVSKQRGITIGYLPQQVELSGGRTLLEEASILPPELGQIEVELTRIEHQLADPTIYNDFDKLQRAMDRQER